MKFKKFVKTLASSGVIYERNNGGYEERWLASPSVLMLIPIGTRSVTGCAIQTMPDPIDRMIDQIGNTQYAKLTKALMPIPDGKIKDCIRVFKTESGDLSILISNDDWSLIENSDFCEILYRYDISTEKFEVKALLVKSYPKLPDDEAELVGIIFPTEYAEQTSLYD